jgi:hypothetical protein
MPRRSRQRLHVGALALAAAALGVLPSFGQSGSSSTPPATQDVTLRSQLGLGNPAGCLPLLGLAANASTDDLVARIKDLGQELGNELRAICGPSAVTSASALGGGLQSLQPVKTVTQFRLARSRIDQRRATKPPAPRAPGRSLNGGWVQFQSPVNPTANLGPRRGAGIFGEVEFITRDRADTSYESGYESDVTGVSLGADYALGGATIGGWYGRTKQDAAFTRFSAIYSGTDGPDSTAVLNDPGVLSKVCGGLSNGGTFEQTANQIGGFAGFGGAHGFVDAAYAWTRRDHEYARSVCAIETQGLVTFTGGVLRDTVHDPVDDIYAGVLSGLSTIDESSFSFRAGGDAGNGVVSAGPRAIFTLTRATTGAFVETGRNTVSNDITASPADALPVIKRTPGGPIGLELAFDEQSRTSVLLEAGGEVAVHAGPVSPFFSGYWRHEFNNDFPVVTAHMAQDLRATPAVLTFGYDAYDSDAFQYGFGANAAAGDRVVARVEFTKLVSDALFSGHRISVQARVRF